MDVLTLALGLVIVLLTLRTIPLVVAWVRVAGTRLRWPGVTLTGRGALPDELDPVYDDIEARLQELGFHYHHAQVTEALSVAEGPKPQRVYLEPETDTYATVSPTYFPSSDRVADVTFQTSFVDDHTIATFDDVEHRAFAFPPSWDVRDYGLDDLDAQWQAHREAVLARRDRFATTRFDPETYVMRAELRLAETVAYLAREERAAAESGGATLRMRPGAAWSMARSITRGQRRLSAREASRQRREAKGEAGDRRRPSEDARIAAQVHAFQYLRDAQDAGQRAPAVDRFLFVLSAVLFSLAVGYFFGWRFVPLLVVVILAHELGHLAGMALFGYRDRRILFIPFVGAAAIGSKENATALQRFVVLMLGPLPGLAAGAALLLAMGGFHAAGVAATQDALHSWLFDFGVAAVVLNYLNLLPILPLDGGRIVQTLFLGRFPRGQAVFFLGSGLLLGAGGFVANDVVLYVLAALTLLAVPWQWRHGTIARHAARKIPAGASRTDRLRAIFTTLENRDHTPSAQRFQLARDVLEHLEAPRARTATILLGSLLYLAVLIGAPIAAAIALTVGATTILPVGPISSLTR